MDLPEERDCHPDDFRQTPENYALSDQPHQGHLYHHYLKGQYPQNPLEVVPQFALRHLLLC
jgi:hypothetical protein